MVIGFIFHAVAGGLHAQISIHMPFVKQMFPFKVKAITAARIGVCALAGAGAQVFAFVGRIHGGGFERVAVVKTINTFEHKGLSEPFLVFFLFHHRVIKRDVGLRAVVGKHQRGAVVNRLV